MILLKSAQVAGGSPDGETAVLVPTPPQFPPPGLSVAEGAGGGGGGDEEKKWTGVLCRIQNSELRTQNSELRTQSSELRAQNLELGT